MKRIILLLVLVLTIPQTHAQELYSKTFGDPKNTAVLYLHGGPGYNAASFEISTAQKLADNGFYVVIYDRRGEGRSADPNSKFTFEETFDDINDLLKKYYLQKVNLIGHSFGGVIAALYSKKNPEKVNSITLIGAPVSLQETFKTILRSSRKIYLEKNDKTNLNYIDMIEKMNPASVEYYAYSFGHAMQNGFYNPKNLSEETKSIYANSQKEEAFKYTAQMNREAPQGFLKNENYTSIDLTKTLEKLVSNKTRIYAMYGKEDGLYSPEQVIKLQEIIGKKNLNYLNDCSHNIFIDQQSLFIDSIKKWLR